MKRFLFFLTTILVFSACSNSEEDAIDQGLPPTSSEEGMYTYIMTMNEDAKPVDEAQTRATSAGAWQNQDTIHIFFGGVNAAYAEGIYDSGSNRWTVKSAKQLSNVQNEKCTIVHYKGINKWHNNDAEPWMEYYYLTDWYSTEEGRYDFSNGTITISAQLRRPYWRLRFKGEPGTKFRIEPTGISYLMRTSKTENQTTDLSLTLTIKEDGYSDYFVGITKMECSQIRIIYTKTDFSYSRYFDEKILPNGESGCLTLPTEESLHGWQRCSYHDFVDLGLPSGKLWATCNMGAESPYQIGKYYAWGEIEGYYDYENHDFHHNYRWGSNMDSYGKYNKSDKKIQLDLEDDAANVCWGDHWRIPTKEDLEELINHCTLSEVTMNGKDGYQIKGPNGKFVFFPTSGYYSDYNSSPKHYDPNLLYILSSTISPSDKDHPYAFVYWLMPNYYSNNKPYVHLGSRRDSGLPIRPICEP